jgi:hypothetical protein
MPPSVFLIKILRGAKLFISKSCEVFKNLAGLFFENQLVRKK